MLDWTHDWSAYLQSAETISTSIWSISPTTVSPLTQDSESETTTTATIWLSGGLLGQVYRAVNRITTSQNRTEERTLVVRVENQ